MPVGSFYWIIYIYDVGEISGSGDGLASLLLAVPVWTGGEEDVGVSVGGGDSNGEGLEVVKMDQTYLYLNVCSLKSWYFFSLKRKAVCCCETSSSS